MPDAANPYAALVSTPAELDAEATPAPAPSPEPTSAVEVVETDSPGQVTAEAVAPPEAAPDPAPIAAPAAPAPTVSAEADRLARLEASLEESREQSRQLTAQLSAEAKANREWRNKMAEANGLPTDPEPAAPVVTTSTAPSAELADLRRRVEYAEVRAADPTADPDKLWEESVNEAMSHLGLSPTMKPGDKLPDDISEATIQRIANTAWERKKAALRQPKPVPVAAPAAAARRAPPVTSKGARITAPAAPTAAGGNQYQEDGFAKACKEFLAPAD